MWRRFGWRSLPGGGDHGDAATATEEGVHRQSLETWSVEELAARVVAADAEGLAAQLRANAVNGADFLELSQQEFNVGNVLVTKQVAMALFEVKTR